MNKKIRTARKVLSVFLSVLMILTTWTVAVPGLVLAADEYYVRVYLNIYDGANSDGYGKAYTVVDDINSEFYGKPDDYKWDYGSSWSATDNSDGYDGEINMAGFTLFYDNDKQYKAYDLSADLVEATTTLGNKFTSMDELTLENFASCADKVEKVYAFSLDSLPSSLFWINDENNAINGETSFGIHKITVAKDSTSQEHILWTGLSGSESYYECYYGTITPTGIITPWDDCPDATTYTFYKDYTTSAVGTWIDPFNAGDYNTYPVNNYLSGGVSATFTVGNSGSQTNVDYIDVGNTNNYYINFTNHSTQEATITWLENSNLVDNFTAGFTLASKETKSFVINKSAMTCDEIYTESSSKGYHRFAFKYKLDNVYNSDGTTQMEFYQAAGIGAWNTTDDSKEIDASEDTNNTAGFVLYQDDSTFRYNINVSNKFAVSHGILERNKPTTGNRTRHVEFNYNYWLESTGMDDWDDTGLRLVARKYTNYRHVFQETRNDGTLSLEGAIANNDASISMADIVKTYTDPSDAYNRPDVSNRPWAYVNSPCKPFWDEQSQHRYGTVYDNNTDGIFRFCGKIFAANATTTDSANIVFNNMTWRDYEDDTATFSGTINVYVFDKTQLRDYVRSLGGLGANWAPMRTRFNDAEWNAYEIALAEAMKVLANQKTNQKAVTDAYNELYRTTEALKATASLKSQVAEVTYTQRTTDYNSAVVATEKKYIIMPIGTETTVPAHDAFRYATSGTVVGKQTSNLKTNYTQYDTGINPIDYRYWKIDFAGVDDAVNKATALLDTSLDTYSSAYYEKLFKAREAVSYFDRDADTWTPTYQADISEPLAELNELLAHDSTEPEAHQFINADNGQYKIFFDETDHWYECEVCGYKYAKTEHTLEYTSKDKDTHTVSCSYVDSYSGNTCDYTYEADHNWNNGEVTSAPDCNNDGVKTFTCEDCGATKTEAITSDGHSYAVADAGDGTHINKCSKCGANYPGAVAEAHTYTYVINADGTHTATCSVCSATETVAHVFTNPTLERPTLVGSEWKMGTYTYSCICGETKTEDAVRADYSAFDEAVEKLNELNGETNLTDDAKTAISNALAAADGFAKDRVTAEQGEVDAFVKELNVAITNIEKIIYDSKDTSSITQATSGITVEFIEKTGVAPVESVQLKANGGFDTVRMKISNNNKDVPVTITSVVADKAYIGATDSASSATFSTKTELAVDGSKDLYIVSPTNFSQAGIITYTITYKVGNDADGYLMDEDGNALEFTVKAYLYVKAAAYTPYHFMDEKTGIGGVSKWDHFVEATNYGDFSLVSNNTASKFSDKLESGTKWYSFGTAHTSYDYDEDGCQAGCTADEFVSGDGHAATYRYFVDTSLAPTWQAAGFRLRIAETKESTYENAPLKTIRVANDQAYLDGIQGDDKTFTLTFYPSASGTQNKTWAITSTGTLDVAVYANPDETNELLFGEHKNREGFSENTALALLSGEIPSAVNEAKFMLSPRIEFNGTIRSESVTMTSHIWLTSYNKAELREAVANAELAGYNPGYFDAEKYEAYENALETAKEVLGKAETNQDEVDAAKAGLDIAIENLTKTESEVKFVLTVTHSIHENADKNSEATDTQYDYYLVSGEITPALKADVIALDTINKYDDEAILNVTADATHTYNYWFIDYSDVQDAIDAADEIINDTTTGYSDEYKQQVEEAKDALQDILDGKDVTTVPESQDAVDGAIDAVTDLTGHTCDEKVGIEAKDATCLDTGLTAGAKCSVCGKITKAQTVTPAFGHTFGNEKTANKATCLAPGNDAYKQCTVCNLYFAENALANSTEGKADDTSFVLEQLQHSYTGTYQWNNNAEPKTHSQLCVNGCNEYNPVGTPCTFEETTQAPTCTAGGKTTYTCTVCKNSYFTTTSPSGHDWSAWVLSPTPTEDSEGTYTRTCSKGDATETKSVEREDYSVYDETIKNAEALLDDEKLTDAAKDEIRDAIEEAKELDQNLPADVVEDGKTIIDNNSDEIIKDATDKLQEVIDKITDDETGAYVKPDSTAAEEAVEKAEALEGKIELPEDVKAEIESLREELDKILEEINDDDNATAAEYQERLKDIEDAAKEILEKYAECEINGHDFGDAEIVYPVKDDEDNWSQGTYTYTCKVCGYVKVETYNRANYEAYDKAVADLNDLLADETITNAAKTEIRNILIANSIADNLMTPDQKKVDDAAAALKAEVDKITNDKTGAYEKVDYTKYDTAVDAYEALADVITDEDRAAVKAITDEIDKIPEDGSKKDYQDTVDAAADAIAAINAKYSGCAEGNHSYDSVTTKPTCTEGGYTTHTCTVCGHSYQDDETSANGHTWGTTGKFTADTSVAPYAGYYTYDCTVEDCDGKLKIDVEAADYSELDSLVEALEKIISDNPGLTDDAKNVIQNAIDKAEAIPDDLTKTEKKDGVTTPDGQKIIDDLVDELEDVITNIENAIEDGSALEPDYEAWEDAETEYDALDKTNVKTEIITEAKALKDAIADKQADDSLTQATATQKDIDDATARLNEIITGIGDGTLIKPADFTEVDKDLADAKDKAENNEVLDSVKEEIQEIEDRINELKNDPATNANDQDEIDTLEDRLEEIITGIEDGTLIKPADFTEVDKDLADAKDKAENNEVLDSVKEEIQEIEDRINELKNDPETNANDQDEIDTLEDRLEEIIKAIENSNIRRPDFGPYDASHDIYEGLVEQYGDKIKGIAAENVAELDAIVDAVRYDETATWDDDQITVDVSKDDLDDIIEAIKNGTLLNVDYAEVDKDLADVKEKAESNNLLDSVKEDIKELEDKLYELKNDPTTNAKDNQIEVDALEDSIEAIIAGVEDNSLVKPDYTEADAAIKKAGNDIDNGGNVSDEDKATVNELRKELNNIKKDPTSNKKDDQGAVDAIKAQLQQILDKYSQCEKGEHSYAEKVIAPECENKGYTEHKCTVCGKIYKDNYTDALGHNIVKVPVVEPTCSSVGYTESRKCSTCGKITVKPNEISKLPHTDKDEDGTCDVCGQSDLYLGCPCICHNTNWFMRFVYKILRFFWKIFNIHQECPCGALHF